MVGLMEKKYEKVINKKLTEHILETEATQEELDRLKKQFAEKKETEVGFKLAVLKDKLIFHKACSMALQDVLDEVSK